MTFVLFATPGILLVYLANLPHTQQLIKSFTGINSGFYIPATTTFSFIAAFLGAAVWGSFTLHADAIKQEHQAIDNYVQVIIKSPGLDQAALIPFVKSYVASVVQDEWQLLAEQKLSSRTHDLFEVLYQRSLETAASASSPLIGGLLIRAIESIQQSRLKRIDFRWHKVESLRWIALIALGWLAQISTALTHLNETGRPLKTAMTIITSLIFIVTVIIAMSVNHFEGIVKVSPDDLIQTLQFLNK